MFRSPVPLNLIGGVALILCASLGACNAAAPTPSPVAPEATVQATAPSTMVVYVGVGAWEGPKGGIFVYDFDQKNGTLLLKQEVPVGRLATFLAVAPNRRTLYVADEPTHDLSCFRIDPQQGTLTKLCQATGRGNPVYLAVDSTGKTLLAASYNQGLSETFTLLGDGSIGPSADLESSGRRSHAIVLDRTHRFAFVPALEDDWIAQYRFDPDTHQLTPNPDANSFTLGAQKGSGPRHFTLDSDNEFGYLVNELNLTVASYRLDGQSGKLTPAHAPVSALGPGVAKPEGASAADIHLHPNGRFLYSSNRMGDKSSISIFSLDPVTGAPSFLSIESTRGKTPRNFKLSPDGKFLLVANQDSKNLVSFSINPDSGALGFIGQVDLPEKPHFVGFMPLGTD